jgi:putative ribosome biogenesis GTPase RsgA
MKERWGVQPSFGYRRYFHLDTFHDAFSNTQRSKHEAALSYRIIAVASGHHLHTMAYKPATPEITVLLMGDAEVGKSTFLS